MRKIIYLGLVGFLFITGFLNLDGNDWKPVALPKFTNNFFENEERILPSEEWRKVLVGKWDYLEIYNDEFINGVFKGTVLFNSDSTYTKVFNFIGRINQGHEVDVSGSSSGTWEMQEESECWTESNDDFSSSFSERQRFNIEFTFDSIL